MRLMKESCRSALRGLRAVILVPLLGLGGCYLFDVKPGENIADEYGEFAGFCGFLQHCGTRGNGGGHSGQVSDDSSDSDSDAGSDTGTGIIGD